MNKATRFLLFFATSVLAACSLSADDGKRFIGVWESNSDPLHIVEIVRNGENFMVTVQMGVPGPADDMVPEIRTTAMHPAALKDGMLALGGGLLRSNLDVMKESGELVFGGERYKLAKGPRRCSAEDKQCTTMFELYRMNPQFRDLFHAALKSAHIVMPDWIPFGVTGPNKHTTVNGQAYVFSWIGEPHWASHSVYIGYNESRQNLFGVYADSSGKRISFGAKDEIGICPYFDEYACRK